MYKHARGKEITPPALRSKESSLEREFRLTKKFLLRVASAHAANRPIPKMPKHLRNKYDSSIKSAGGLSEWAEKRPEWGQAIKAAARTRKRIEKSKALHESTKGVGKPADWTTGGKNQRKNKK